MSNSPAFEQAMQKLASGDRAGAEQTMSDAVRAARDGEGAESAAYAAALFEQSMMLALGGDKQAALEPLTVAVSIRASGEEATRARLTYAMNLGGLLGMLGRHADAEAVLRASLDDRAAFYGTTHPGYAFGLEPLVEALAAQERTFEAEEAARTAVGIYWEHGHERTPTAIATHARMLAALGQPAFDRVAALPDALLDMVGEAAIAQVDDSPPPVVLRALRELYAIVTRRRGAGDPFALKLAGPISNAARLAGDHQTRFDVLRTALTELDGLGEERRALDVTLALALAAEDLDQLDEVDRLYDGGLARAKALGDPAVRARVLLQHGLFRSQRREGDGAAAMFVEALDDAERADDAELVARVRIAQGVLAQHSGDPAAARPLFEAGLAALPPADPDALAAQSHLQAIETGSTCGCGMVGAMSRALQSLMAEELPPDLQGAVTVHLTQDGSPAIGVLRDLTEDDARQIHAAYERAVGRLGRVVRERALQRT